MISSEWARSSEEEGKSLVSAKNLDSVLDWVLLKMLIGSCALAAEVTGAGSTFAYPIISKWADVYKKETGTTVNYQSIGSGGGIKLIQSHTVDFGASDIPLQAEQLTKSGLLQFPIINGGIVPIFHLNSVNELQLTGPVLTDIFSGKIKKWNHPDIVQLNPNLTIPDRDITVVHRSDGSGTTFIWTHYLSQISSSWKEKTGEGSAINWPTGIGGKGNEGVASYVQRINGSIGYVEYAYALQNKINAARLKNRSGEFVIPNAASFQSATTHATWNQSLGFYLLLTNMPGKNSWPIVGSTFILIQKTQIKPEQAKEILKFFRWAYHHGKSLAQELDYISVPDPAVKLIEHSWKTELKDQNDTSIILPIYSK